MADNINNQKKPSGTVGEVTEAVKVVFDPITKVGEGIIQLLNKLADDLNFLQKIAMLVVMGVSVKEALIELRKLVKDDPKGTIEKIQYLKRKEFIDWLEKRGEKAWKALKAAFEEVGKGYNYLKKRKLMSDNDLKALLKKLNDFSENSKKQRKRSLCQRKLFFRIGVPALIALLFCAASDPKYLPWIGGAIIVLLIVVGAVIMFQNKAPEAPASPIRRTS